MEYLHVWCETFRRKTSYVVETKSAFCKFDFKMRVKVLLYFHLKPLVGKQ